MSKGRQLIQERYAYDPWKLLVACICCNLVSGKRADGVVDAFFQQCPTMTTAIQTAYDWKRLTKAVDTLKPLGLSFTRYRRIVEMSEVLGRHYSMGGGVEDLDVASLPGCGQYAADSYAIFVLKSDDVEPKDKELRAYLERSKA